jgi:hypothetical protein
MLLQTLVSNLFRHIKNNRSSVNTEEVCWMVNILLALILRQTYFGILQFQIQMSDTNMFDN